MHYLTTLTNLGESFYQSISEGLIVIITAVIPDHRVRVNRVSNLTSPIVQDRIVLEGVVLLEVLGLKELNRREREQQQQ